MRRSSGSPAHRSIPRVLLFAVVACATIGCRGGVVKDQTRVAVTDSAKQSYKPIPKIYSNDAFRNVSVERRGDSTFRVSGQARVFEAAFGWTVEDGHNELAQGRATADAGAPAWGRFQFDVHANKRKGQSTVHLVLYESSPRDGSRQHELPVPLY